MPTTLIFKFFENLVDPFEAEIEAPCPTSSVSTYVRSQIQPFFRLLPFMATVGLLKAALECWIVFYSGTLIDKMITSGPEAFLATYKFELFLVTIVVLLARPMIIGLDHLFLDQTVGSNLQEQVRWHSHRMVLNQPSSFFKNELAGRLTNRIMQMGQSVEEGVHATFDAIWFAFAYVLSAIVVLSGSDWRLGIPLAIWVLIYGIYVRSMAFKVVQASQNWSNARSRMSGKVVDAYSNIETVKTYSRDNYEQNYALDGLKDLRHHAASFRRLMTKLALGINLLNGVMIVGVMAPAVWLWTRGLVTPGDVAAAVALTIRLNGMTGWILFVTTRLFENVGNIRDGLGSINPVGQLVATPNAHPLQVRTGHIHFQDVSFRYRSDQNGLNIAHLEIRPRQKVGIVGASGAGKSTLVRLLTRLDEPASGQIYIDGQDIRHATQESVRNAIAVVSQDTSLMHRSIRENLAYGDRMRREDEIVAAAKRALAHDFILTLSDSQGRRGYDAVVGERGAVLSGGQRQRISIARAILKDAPILVLDEATSALDSEVESNILLSMNDFLVGRTVIAIAHRLSTLSQMDRIVVLDHGRIAEDGKHHSLLRDQHSLYWNMWRKQSQMEGID